jgi:uncharacterized protein with gpF-like domain
MRYAREQAFWSVEDRERYARALREAIRRTNRLEGEALRDVRRMLEELRRETVDRIAWAQQRAEAGYSTFDLARLSQLQSEIDENFRELRLRFGAEAQDAAARMAAAEAAVVDAPLIRVLGAELEGQLPGFGLARSIAAASAQVQSSLITRVSQETVRAISNEISLGASGLKNPFEVMQAVGRDLDDPSIFGTIEKRAITITRTELGRVQSVAGQARKEQAATVVPAMKKQWQWSGKSRVEHAAAHGQIRDVDEDFDVGGERLSFPRDPQGSPENTINCGCASLPYITGLSEELPGMA